MDQKVTFPNNTNNLSQDEEFLIYKDGGDEKQIKFHDYAEIYKIPGLYEHLFYTKLKCNSPDVVANLLSSSVCDEGGDMKDLKVLDFGAGNGMVGEALKAKGANNIIGADILHEASFATERDRPNIYQYYIVDDFTNLTIDNRTKLESQELDCLVTVAALGFGDIPAEAFINAFNMVKNNGYIAFNIKKDFLNPANQSGFSEMVSHIISEEIVSVIKQETYVHRLSMNYTPLEYTAFAMRKNSDIAYEEILV